MPNEYQVMEQILSQDVYAVSRNQLQHGKLPPPDLGTKNIGLE